MKTLDGLALLSLLACAGCGSTPGYEFPGIKGQVVDAMTQAPIPGARIDLAPFGGSGLVLMSASDANGRFEIQQPVKHFSLSLTSASATQAWVDAHMDVSADGYETQHLAVLDLTKRNLPDMAVSLSRR